MATWTCVKCGEQNSEMKFRCSKCNYPQYGTDKEKMSWEQENNPNAVQEAAILDTEIKQKDQPDYAYISQAIAHYGQAQVNELKSINGKLNFIVWVIIISIALQIVAAWFLLRL